MPQKTSELKLAKEKNVQSANMHKKTYKAQIFEKTSVEPKKKIIKNLENFKLTLKIQ